MSDSVCEANASEVLPSKPNFPALTFLKQFSDNLTIHITHTVLTAGTVILTRVIVDNAFEFGNAE